MHVDVTVRGKVAPEAVQTARNELGALERIVKGPLTHARVVLIQEENPRIALGARAEGEVLLAGRPVRARAAHETMAAAVDEMAERLHDQLRGHVERIITSPPRPSRARAPADAVRAQAAWRSRGRCSSKTMPASIERRTGQASAARIRRRTCSGVRPGGRLTVTSK